MPSISTISPSTFDDGKPVTLTGSGFGSSTGQVLIGGVAQNVNTWADDEITFTTVRGSQSLGACRVDVVRGSADWQLASGHWVPRKFDAVIAHPRPTAETAVYEQHRNAYPSVAWSTRVLVFGGAYPFRFELVTAPVGMTIGETLVASGDVLIEPANYGKLEWSNPTAGDHTITVRVYDQDYGRAVNPSAPVEVTWTLTVGTSNWVFLSPTGSNTTGDGSFSAPFASTAKFLGTSAYQNKCVYLLAGTHYLVGDAANGNYARSTSTTKPWTFVGYPGANAKLVLDTGHFNMNSGACLKDLTLEHSVTPYGSDQKIIVTSGAVDRILMLQNQVTRFTYGASTAANGGVFVPYNTSFDNKYLCQAYNTFTGQQGAGWHSYKAVQSVVHGNRWHNCQFTQFDASNTAVVFLKASNHGVSVRANQIWENNNPAGILNNGTPGGITICWNSQREAGDTDPPYALERVEICYNTLYSPSDGTSETGGSRLAALRLGKNDANDIWSDCHVYRNSIAVRERVEQGNTVTPSKGPCSRSFNVLSGGDTFDSWILEGGSNIGNDNLDGGSYLNLSSMKLTGASRSSYLGTHGAEVA